jgi:hypothetical protein
MNKISGANVYDSTGNKIKLINTDYLTSGGEGDIYEKNGLIFKIFNTVRNNDFDLKLKKLSIIKNKQIAFPLNSVYDGSNNLIGFSMNKIQGEPIVKVFSTVWQQENKFNIDMQIKLVNDMRDLLIFIHSKNALVVDGNEMNWLYDTNFKLPSLIDVDSWQIDKFNATAIMPSIKDWHADKFSTLSDWFSWAIVSFQVFTGIHPFKGTHQSFKKGDVPARMRANVSVFNKDVKLNSAVRDLNLIPKELKEWYRSVFEGGERTIPPIAILSNQVNKFNKVATHINNVINLLEYRLIKEFPLGFKIKFINNDLFLIFSGKKYIVWDLLTDKSIDVVEKIGNILMNSSGFVQKIDNKFFCLYTEAGKLIVEDIQDYSRIENTFSTDNILLFNNRIFIKNNKLDTTLMEVSIKKINDVKYIISVNNNWRIYVKATTFFKNVAITNNLGNYFIFYPYENNNVLIAKMLIDKNLKIINAIALNKNIMVVFTMDRLTSVINKLVMKLQGNDFIILSSDEVDTVNDSFAVNNKGIIVSNIGQELEIFSPNLSVRKEIKDDKLFNYNIFAIEDKFYLIENNKVVRISLK